jgi:N-acetylmuramoyl-L-alanine amidase
MRTGAVRRARLVLLFIIILLVGIMVLRSWQDARAGEGPLWLQRLAVAQTLAGRHIGVVAGHSGNDSGTVCLDGLTEASVNLRVAQLVVQGLQQRGATVDLLQEFDPRLAGYQADAFISIHTDSCKVDITFTGYKVASLEGGSDASAQFVSCLWQTYGAATGLPTHEATITSDMRGYHAFHEIAPDTPAAIIEIGFLNADRQLLTEHPERPAEGIIAGFECFLSAKKASNP